VLAILVTIGVILSVALMQVRQERMDRERRMLLLRAGGGGRGSAVAIIPEPVERGRRYVLGPYARRFFAAGLPRRWGMTAGAIVLMSASIGGAVASWVVLRYAIGLSELIALLISVAMAYWAPRALLKYQQSGSDKRFMEVFPDTIDMVIRMLRAGLPITTAVGAVGLEASPPVSLVFTDLGNKMAIGISFEDALLAEAKRIALTDFRFFAVAISLQRETGGNLAVTLDVLSDLMRKRRAARLKARATTGEVRMTALVLGGIPFLIIGALLVVTPNYLHPLFADPRGHVILAVACGSMLTGFLVIRQMMRSVTSVS
jgi:tight adherence protein B